MNLSSLFSDDQMAIIGCFVALGVCGLIAAVSYRFGSAGQRSADTGRVVPMPRTHAVSGESRQDRRAA